MFWRKRKPSDFSAEVEAHLELETERLKEEGMSEEEARLAARRSFGNVTRAQERFYESGRWVWWNQLCQDIRYGLRMLRRSPGFAVVALLSLALGIGANTAIFQLLDAVRLRMLPVSNPQELAEVRLPSHYGTTGNFFNWHSSSPTRSGSSSATISRPFPAFSPGPRTFLISFRAAKLTWYTAFG